MIGWLGLGTGLTFAAASVFLGLFFVTKDERFDRSAEWLFVVFAGLAVVLALVVDHRLATVTDLSGLVALIGARAPPQSACSSC